MKTPHYIITTTNSYISSSKCDINQLYRVNYLKHSTILYNATRVIGQIEVRRNLITSCLYSTKGLPVISCTASTHDHSNQANISTFDLFETNTHIHNRQIIYIVHVLYSETKLRSSSIQIRGVKVSNTICDEDYHLQTFLV